MEPSNHFADFLKYSRSKYRLTQEQLAEKAGVGLRFIRDLEQGKESLRLDKVNQVLALFGYRAAPVSIREIDQWVILMNHLDRHVRIHLKNKMVLEGILVDYKMENQQVEIWRFVSNNNYLHFKETKDDSFVKDIKPDEILDIENT
jgi:y4mF family transcriptional regulator